MTSGDKRDVGGGICLTIALTLALAQAAVADAHTTGRTLPEIGDPSYSTLSFADEKKLGRVILAQIRARLPVTADIEIQEYLRTLGLRLLVQEAGNRLDFHFLPVTDRAINAFATPGGIITINEGLMLFADNESELAAVVAHEIAHVSRRHIARLHAELKTTSWISTLMVIAGLMAGAYNPDLAQLATFAGASLPIDRQLRYSRGFEQEADHVAIQLMAAARIDPRGVPRFFSKLQAREGRRQVPEYLRTHPLTIDRLRDAEVRAAHYPDNLERDGKAFQYMQARLRALRNTEAAPAETKTETLRLYHKGIALTQRQLAHEALQTLGRIPERERSLPVMLALSQAHIARGDYRKARDVLTKLNELHPGRASVNYYLAICLLETDGARRALQHLRRIKALHRYHPLLHKLSAKAATALKRDSLGHEHLADYYLLNGRLELALRQLRLAGGTTDADPALHERIKNKRAEIISLQEEFKRRL